MNFNRPLTLASKSPRRQSLLKSCGFEFNSVGLDVDESFPAEYNPYDVARYLAAKKADSYTFNNAEEVVITADTVVIFENEILGKPGSKSEALETLSILSGNAHDVVTGVCIRDKERKLTFDDLSKVYFKVLTDRQINFYVDEYKPYDKAGAYGIQDWLGMIGIEKLVGSYFNVMGLPTHKVYHELMKFAVPPK